MNKQILNIKHSKSSVFLLFFKLIFGLKIKKKNRIIEKTNDESTQKKFAFFI